MRNREKNIVAYATSQILFDIGERERVGPWHRVLGAREIVLETSTSGRVESIQREKRVGELMDEQVLELVLVIATLHVLVRDGDERHVGRGAQTAHLAGPRARQRVVLGHAQERLGGGHDDHANVAFVERFFQIVAIGQKVAQHVARSFHGVRRCFVRADDGYAVGFRVALVKVAELEVGAQR